MKGSVIGLKVSVIGLILSPAVDGLAVAGIPVSGEVAARCQSLPIVDGLAAAGIPVSGEVATFCQALGVSC